MTRRRTLAQAGVELTPLIDVVFLLLIFFMVTATFIRENQLDIELPTASGVPRAIDAEAIELSVHRDGTYRVNGKHLENLSPAGLTAALADATGDADVVNARLVVAADAESTHQSVITALEAARQAGLMRIRMVTRQPDVRDFRAVESSRADTTPPATGDAPDAG